MVSPPLYKASSPYFCSAYCLTNSTKYGARWEISLWGLQGIGLVKTISTAFSSMKCIFCMARNTAPRRAAVVLGLPACPDEIVPEAE